MHIVINVYTNKLLVSSETRVCACVLGCNRGKQQDACSWNKLTWIQLAASYNLFSSGFLLFWLHVCILLPLSRASFFGTMSIFFCADRLHGVSLVVPAFFFISHPCIPLSLSLFLFFSLASITRDWDPGLPARELLASSYWDRDLTLLTNQRWPWQSWRQTILGSCKCCVWLQVWIDSRRERNSLLHMSLELWSVI